MSSTKKTPPKPEPQPSKANELKKRELTEEEQARLEAHRQREGRWCRQSHDGHPCRNPAPG